MQLIQLNLQSRLGGGEMYTAACARAAETLGIPNILVSVAGARFWDALLPTSTKQIVVRHPDEVPNVINGKMAWVLNQAPFPNAVAETLAKHHLATSMAHMPMYQRSPKPFEPYAMVFPVSLYVRSGLEAAGIPTWHEALYGIPDLRPRSANHVLKQRSEYDWDIRKFRDRVFGLLEPLWQGFQRSQIYRKPQHLTLGVVSRLTPIKQFPELFAMLAPVLAKQQDVHLEIFGSGGYASVRDLKHALRPMGARVRFWGHQDDVRAIYENIDYLVAGLPEKEALGLNILEAQACGTKVLAVNAPPFSETIADGITGHLFADPRQDCGQGFGSLIEKLCQEREHRIPDEIARQHLEQFSFDAFASRFSEVAQWAEQRLSATTAP